MVRIRLDSKNGSLFPSLKRLPAARHLDLDFRQWTSGRSSPQLSEVTVGGARCHEYYGDRQIEAIRLRDCVKDQWHVASSALSFLSRTCYSRVLPPWVHR